MASNSIAYVIIENQQQPKYNTPEMYHLWLEFRERNATAVTASKVCARLGIGYQSYNKEINSDDVGPLPGSTAETFINHGLKWEPIAKRFIYCYLKIPPEVVLDNDIEVTRVFEFCCIGTPDIAKKVTFMGTPDIILDDQIIEIKCPAKGPLLYHTSKDMASLAHEYSIKHPQGPPRAFMQAFLYAFFWGKDKFSTYHLFVYNDEIDGVAIMFTYKMIKSAELYKYIFTLLKEIEHHLIRKLDIRTAKKYIVRDNIARINWVTDLMKQCFIESFIINHSYS